MTTAAILPGFTLPAATAPQPGAPAALSASAFGDLLSAFTGAGETPEDGQGQENPETTCPETMPEPLATPVSGLGQLGGWTLPAPFVGNKPQQFHTLLGAPGATSQPASGQTPPALFEPLAGQVPVIADGTVPDTNLPASGDSPEARDWPLQAEMAAALPTAAETAVPAPAVAVPLPAEQAARPAVPAAAAPGNKIPGTAPTAVPAAAPPPAQAAFDPDRIPSAPSASPATLAVLPVPAGSPAAPAPAVAQAAVDSPVIPVHGTHEEKLTAPTGEPRVQAVVESSPRTAESILQPVPAPATDAPKASGPAAAAIPAAAAQPMATQLVRPLFTLATEAPGEHVMTMKVSPEDLGPVTVRAHISSEGVRLEMFAAGDAGRDAVRAALPELRRELALQGLAASLDLSGRNSPEHGQPQPQQHRGNQDQGGPYRSNLRMVTEAEPTSGQPARTMSSTAALDVVA